MTNYKLALIGYPLGHSLSPVLYNAAFKQLGLEGSYELLPTESEDLISRIKYLRANKYYGFNVTIPHKVPVSLFVHSSDVLSAVSQNSSGVISGLTCFVRTYIPASHGVDQLR